MHSESKPWGSFLILETRPGYQVKRITVDPGAKLSLQSHRQRSEHWTVVAGEAIATIGGQSLRLGQGQSVDIPVDCRHRLENPGSLPLEVIEIQFGEYLGEDDIVRHEDMYNRI